VSRVQEAFLDPLEETDRVVVIVGKHRILRRADGLYWVQRLIGDPWMEGEGPRWMTLCGGTDRNPAWVKARYRNKGHALAAIARFQAWNGFPLPWYDYPEPEPVRD
jgi:hypothetical protein